jgi:protein ImuB
LTGDLSAFLCGRDSGVQRFDLHLEHAGLPDTLIKVGLLSAERDPAMLFELARGRLEQVQVEAPVRGFRLRAEDLPSFVPQFQELFDDRPQQTCPGNNCANACAHGWAMTRCRACAFRPITARVRVAGRRRPQPCAGFPSVQRPGWLLTEPQRHEGSTRILMGPERIESGWWDGDDVRRDYYLIQNP